MKYLVTGAAGFIGAKTIEVLLSKGASVVGGIEGTADV